MITRGPAWGEPSVGRIRRIDARALKAMLDLGREVALIDVRRHAAYLESHLRGAENVPLDERFDDRIRERIGNRHGPLVVYGDSSSDTRRASRRIAALGVSEVYAFEEGIESWRRATLPLA